MGLGFKRSCKATTAITGEPCRQAPLRERDFCFWHDPDNAETAAEARRLGQQRSRREASVSGAYELGGLSTVADLRRVLEIVLIDTLALQNGVPRNRLLVSLVQAGATLLKDGEFEERLEALESVMGDRLKKAKMR